MSDKSPDLATNLPEFSVSELSRALKRTVEDSYPYVRVRGEVSGFKRAASGHLYMTLKDENAVLDAVCWRGTAGRLSIDPEDGLEVICTGKLTTYPGRSKYQIVVEQMEMAGEGALLKLLEDRRKKLAAEGLFDDSRKRELPYLPEVIGVVTSPTGAVIRDILHRLSDRFPRHVLLWPVLVQGDGAADQVTAAIEGFNRIEAGGSVPRPDLIIVARGGGSLEDLWAFNEENVVRAAAASDIPLISAVGHETDTTLIDFASDRRAPTPTAAAEMAVPVRAELQATVLDNERRMIAAMHRLIEDRRLRVEGLARGLPDLDSLIGTQQQRLDGEDERLGNAMQGLLRERGQQVAHWAAQIKPPQQVLFETQTRVAQGGKDLAAAIERFLDGQDNRAARIADRFVPALAERQTRDAEQKLKSAGALLESLSFRRVLDRGYAVVRDTDGNAVMTAATLQTGDSVLVEFSDGRVGADVTETDVTPDPAKKPAPRKPKAKAPTRAQGADKAKADGRQGSLL
jgi:exodeoxyribonuclease VII large subunit